MEWISTLVRWLQDYGTLITNLTGIATLFVWLFYARLLYGDYKRQRRPLIIIHETEEQGSASNCLIVNLSKEPIHILCVLVAADSPNGAEVKRISGLQRVLPDGHSHQELQDSLTQGPLLPGSFLSLGSVKKILCLLCKIPGGPDEPGADARLREAAHDLAFLQVRVIALYSAYEEPVGAFRNFKVTVNAEGEIEFYPLKYLTDQMISKKERRVVEHWVDQCLALGATGKEAPVYTLNPGGSINEFR